MLKTVSSTSSRVDGDAKEQSPRQLIIGGDIASKGRYPYFSTLDHYAGGALIAPDIVLTAGHVKPSRPELVSLRVGTYSFHHDAEGVDYELIDIVKAVRHPLFQRLGDDEFRHDFTILKLATKSSHPVVQYNRDPSIPAPGTMVTVMGTGDTNPDKPSRSDVLREASLTVIGNEQCEESADPDDIDFSYQGRIHPSMMCTTGGPHNEKDSCSYDSGSPIILPGYFNGQDLLVGLVSWGEECADENFPGVNSRISLVSGWIDETVCAISSYPPDFCFPTAPTMSPSSATLVSSLEHYVSHHISATLLVIVVMLGASFFHRTRQTQKTNSSERQPLSPQSTGDISMQSYDSIESDTEESV